MPTTRARAAKIAWSLAILLAAASAGIVVDWRAPGLGRYATDWLMRARGPLPVPDDIAIVAIDEASMARFGRFPWSRQVIARTIDALAAARPKVIALDTLFPHPTPRAAHRPGRERGGARPAPRFPRAGRTVALAAAAAGHRTGRRQCGACERPDRTGWHCASGGNRPG